MYFTPGSVGTELNTSGAEIDGKLDVVVAIPARNEAERLPACLEALQQQTEIDASPLRRTFGVAIFANNCDDDTADVARAFARQARFPMRIVAARLPQARAHAGAARRTVMDMAEAWLAEVWPAGEGAKGFLLTTDADSRVGPTWIARNCAVAAGGVDAVLGRLTLDAEQVNLPAALHARGRLEGKYEAQLTEIAARLDPEAHDPWPRHGVVSGATFGITRAAYLAIGGLPEQPLGEDKALAAALRRQDFRLRSCPDIVVSTSARVAGRAPGGVADTLLARSLHPEAPCDAALEPVEKAILRYQWRGRLRRDRAALEDCARALWVPLHEARTAFSTPYFGTAWERLEAASPALRSSLLTPAQLPAQIELADRFLHRLDDLAAAQDINTEGFAALGAFNLNGPIHARHEEGRRIVATQGIVGLAEPMDENDCAVG